MREAEHDAALEEALRRLERDTAGALGAWTDAERADVDAAAREVSRAERARAVHAFEELALVRRPAESRRRLSLAAAAALVIGLLGGWLGRGVFQREMGPGPPILLGTGTERALAPVGPVDRYDRFAWTKSSEGSRSYGLRVWSGEAQKPVLSVDLLTEPSYTLSAEEAASLGPAIRWEVLLQDADGGPVATLVSASASLR
jgi:hypothetical protein